jgi:hypothetical protein
MKTRRNHRKTTNSRRRRVVKQQRGQTRIHYRKGTVSSGRRHKFFKRGGQHPPVCVEENLDTDILKLVQRVKTEYGLHCTVECVHDTTGLYTPLKNNVPLDITSSNKKIRFRILEKSPGVQSVYIYNLNGVNEYVYGRVIMIHGEKNIFTYHPDIAGEILIKLKSIASPS